MKNLLYLLFTGLVILGCAKDASFDDDAADLKNSAKSKQINAKSKADKITVCHKGKTMVISANALASHYDHGDLNPDKDGDGFTAPYGDENPCNLGDGTDCDDNDASVNPAAEEIYTDDIDNNCNGVVGSITKSYQPGPCVGCSFGTVGNYQHKVNDKCRMTEGNASKWVACTVEVITYND